MSIHPISKRQLKSFAARTLPERLKQPLRGLMYGYRKARVSMPVSFVSDAAGPSFAIGARTPVRFGEENWPEVRTHLVDHGAAVEEMASFVAIADGAGTLFDIGADRGIFSLVFCAAGGARRAVAYEPSPTRLAAAARLVALNHVESRLTLRQVAVGDRHGRIAGAIFDDGLMVAESRGESGQAADMALTTVDREVDALGLVPDVIKIDVEGYEYEVLRGASRLLRARKPILCLELHLDLLERRGIAPRTIVDELRLYGYRFRSCVGRPLDPAQLADSVHAILRVVAH